MRLVTRSDFDGLICGMLLKEAGIIDHDKGRNSRPERMDIAWLYFRSKNRFGTVPRF